MDINLFDVEFRHFLDIDADALTVKQDEVDSFDGGRHGGHKVAIDGFQDQLSSRLLWKAVPTESDKRHTFLSHTQKLQWVIIYMIYS